MKTFVVPTDFSDTAKNAALYAGSFAAGIPGAEVILYHAYPEIYAGSDSSPLDDDSNAREKIFSAALESIKRDMLATAPTLRIRTITEERGGFTDALEDLLKTEQADLVFMGITGTSKIEEVLFGSNTLKVIRRNICPVLVVPPSAQFKEINNVLMAADLKEFENAESLLRVRRILELFKAKLHVVNVDADPSAHQQEQEKQKARLLEQFRDLNPEFFFVKDSNVVDTIDQFALDNNIDLIVTVPRKHALGGIFQPGHTKKLAYHTHVPLVAVHE